ncbi:MAG: lipoate protein ligase C-terminal domain-containing protein [Candidatus Methanodesulfokora sp.]
MGRCRIRKEKEVDVVVELESGIIKKVIIGGDFFAFPEGRIDELQLRLVGAHVEDIRRITESVLKSCEIIGIDKSDLIEALEKASSND